MWNFALSLQNAYGDPIREIAECTSPRYVSVPSEIQATCHTLEEYIQDGTYMKLNYIPSHKCFLLFWDRSYTRSYDVVIPQASITGKYSL